MSTAWPGSDDVPDEPMPPPFQRVEVVEIHRPNVTLHYDIFGGVDVKLDDFVFVHINYDHRYTSNAHRAWLAEEIKRLVEGNQQVFQAMVRVSS